MRRVLAAVAWAAIGMSAGRAAMAAPSGYDDYRVVLSTFVDAQGRVDYAGLKKQRSSLDNFVTWLGELSPRTYAGWSERDKIAFWINAYNALTLRAIIDHYPIRPANPDASYPVNSIRQIPGVWDHSYDVMGAGVTLEYIEAKRLRRDFNEPRIHMALVCAAVSCPTLRSEPYDGNRLDTQLDEQSRAFVSDPRHVHIDAPGQRVRVSEIFRWYAEDFAPTGTPATDRAALERAALIAFASPYLGEAERAVLKSAAIEYAPYDWTLNEQPR